MDMFNLNRRNFCSSQEDLKNSVNFLYRKYHIHFFFNFFFLHEKGNSYRFMLVYKNGKSFLLLAKESIVIQLFVVISMKKHEQNAWVSLGTKRDMYMEKVSKLIACYTQFSHIEHAYENVNHLTCVLQRSIRNM